MTVRLLVPAVGKQANALYTSTFLAERALIDAGQADNNLDASFEYPAYLANRLVAPPVTAGPSLSLSNSLVAAGATGNVAQLASSLTGNVTYSKASGAASVTVSSTGAVALSSALAGGASVTFVGRVQNDTSDAIERALTITAQAVTPTPTPTPTLTLSIPAPSLAANASAGTLVSNISNVPAGATPTVTPNDGRLVIAGDASAGWKVVVGMSALSAGTVNFSVAASGATGASGVLTVTAGVTALVYPSMYVIGASVEQFGTGALSAVRWGTTPAAMWTVANELEGSRLYDYDAASIASSPFFAAPTNYASGGAGYTVAGGRTSINAQVNSVAALLPNRPVGKRAVYYSPGRNDLTDGMTTANYLSQQEAHIRRLSGLADVVVVPGLWMRGTSTGGPWASGGAARQSVLDINVATSALCASLPNVIFVPMMDAMCDATGDRNPKAGYTDDDVHPQLRGALAGGKAHRAVLNASGWFTPQAFPTISNLAPSLSSTGGILAGGATGAVPDKFTGTRGDTATALSFSSPAAGELLMSFTRAVNQTATWALNTLAQTTGDTASVGATYRARVRVTIPPTPVPVALEFFISEFKDNAGIARAVGKWLYPNNDHGTVKDAATTGLSAIDATDGIDFWIETVSLPIRSTSGALDIRMTFRLCVATGGTETVPCKLSNYQLERTA